MTRLTPEMQRVPRDAMQPAQQSAPHPAKVSVRRHDQLYAMCPAKRFVQHSDRNSAKHSAAPCLCCAIGAPRFAQRSDRHSARQSTLNFPPQLVQRSALHSGRHLARQIARRAARRSTPTSNGAQKTSALRNVELPLKEKLPLGPLSKNRQTPPDPQLVPPRPPRQKLSSRLQLTALWEDRKLSFRLRQHRRQHHPRVRRMLETRASSSRCRRRSVPNEKNQNFSMQQSPPTPGDCR
mmetsp:Transcript_40200/g.106655  ORF Transcript_40200/g.106655 Transcript_40200/m.106655 type:complete len:237 (-) Transcript_40200:1430-2140(-)